MPVEVFGSLQWILGWAVGWSSPSLQPGVAAALCAPQEALPRLCPSTPLVSSEDAPKKQDM